MKLFLKENQCADNQGVGSAAVVAAATQRIAFLTFDSIWNQTLLTQRSVPQLIFSSLKSYPI